MVSSGTDLELQQAIDNAGCHSHRLAIREALTARLTRRDLLDAAYVVQHSPTLSGGSLVSWIRNGGWPVDGIPTRSELESRIRDGRTGREKPPDVEQQRSALYLRLKRQGLPLEEIDQACAQLEKTLGASP